MKQPTTIRATLVALAFAASAAACTSVGGDTEDDVIDDDAIDEPDTPTPPGGTGSGEDNTFDHPGATPDVWELLERMQEEGPAEYSSRVHSCPKIRYATIGRILQSRGVDLGTTGEIQAGNMYRTSDQALGAPNYAARARENLELTTASASKLFDIFVQAAPEIINAMPTLEACTVGGAPTRMFNDFDQCTPDGITCLIGVPATAGHLEVCNEIVNRASSVETGRLMAVATLLAAAHTCE